MPPEPKPWERQRGESPRSFGLFTVYRDLGPGRSVRLAAEEARKRHGNEGRPGKPPTHHGMENLSRPPYPVSDGKGGTRMVGQDWVRRAAAWDAEQDRIRRIKRVSDFLREDEQEGVALTVLFEKALEATSKLNNPGEGTLRGKDAADSLLEVIRLRRLRRGQATEIQAELPAAPTTGGEEEDDVVARALAGDPELLDRWEAALAREALARIAPGARDADQPGTVDPLPLPAGGGGPPAPDGGAGPGGDPGRSDPPAAR